MDDLSGGRVPLNDGRHMPLFGLGTWRMPSGDAALAVQAAVGIGYRLVDTAAAYANEEGVGRGLRECGAERGRIWVATKLWNTRHGLDESRRAFDESLARLGLDHVDLYLIHWPMPKAGRYVEAWKALAGLQSEGRARSIGVSNFNEKHLRRIMDATGVAPAVNQIECHLAFQQPALRQLHRSLGIVTQAWSPLGRKKGLEDPRLARLAQGWGMTPAEAAIAWHMAAGNAVIPKTASPERMAANLAAASRRLPPGAMEALEALDLGEAGRQGGDPETFEG